MAGVWGPDLGGPGTSLQRPTPWVWECLCSEKALEQDARGHGKPLAQHRGQRPPSPVPPPSPVALAGRAPVSWHLSSALRPCPLAGPSPGRSPSWGPIQPARPDPAASHGHPCFTDPDTRPGKVWGISKATCLTERGAGHSLPPRPACLRDPRKTAAQSGGQGVQIPVLPLMTQLRRHRTVAMVTTGRLGVGKTGGAWPRMPTDRGQSDLGSLASGGGRRYRGGFQAL